MMSKIGIGTVQFGLHYGLSNRIGRTSGVEVTNILSLASNNHIHLLDTASAYGNAEAVLGKNDLRSFKVVSKYLLKNSGDSIAAQLKKSLADLKMSSLYGYLAHRPKELLEEPEQWQYLQEIKEEGIVKKIGFSLNEPEEIERLLNKDFVPDLVQLPFNYFDRRFENLIKELKQQHCEVHSRSTFLQGLFFIKPEELNSFFDEIKPVLNELQNSKELASSLLAFVLENEYIDVIILGVENKEQLLRNIKAVESGRKKLPKLNKKISNHILTPAVWPTK